MGLFALTIFSTGCDMPMAGIALRDYTSEIAVVAGLESAKTPTLPRRSNPVDSPNIGAVEVDDIPEEYRSVDDEQSDEEDGLDEEADPSREKQPENEPGDEGANSDDQGQAEDGQIDQTKGVYVTRTVCDPMTGKCRKERNFVPYNSRGEIVVPHATDSRYELVLLSGNRWGQRKKETP